MRNMMVIRITQLFKLATLAIVYYVTEVVCCGWKSNVLNCTTQLSAVGKMRPLRLRGSRVICIWLVRLIAAVKVRL